MNVDFYTFSKRINSTAQPTGGASYSCVIKSPSSVIAPKISIVWGGSGNPSAYNYAYIADYGRYYWVSNWTYADRQWTADLSVDVLATYKTEIGAASKYILRSASDYNDEVLDSEYPAKLPGRYSHITHSLGWASDPSSGGVYIIGVSGANNTLSIGGVGLYQADGAQANTIIANAYNAQSGILAGTPSGVTLDGSWIDWLGDCLVRAAGGVSNYLKGVMWFPFSFTGGGSVTVTMGLLSSGTGTAQSLSSAIYVQQNTINLPGTGAGQAWRNVSPYLSHFVHFPPFGIIELDSVDVYAATQLRYTVRADALSGSGYLILELNTGSDTANPWEIVATRSAQLGVPVPIGGQTYNMLSGIGSYAGAIGSAYSGNVTGVINGIGNAVSGILGQGRSNGGAGGCSAMTGIVNIFTRRMPPVDEDIPEKGRPLCEVKTISSMSGFVQCRDGDVSAPGTAAELSQIESFLTGGFFYE